MKNKKMFLIVGIVIIGIIVAIVLFINTGKSYRRELNNKDKEIIAENAYINWAWGFQYHGKALFNDGTIYEWDFEGSNTDYDVETTEEHKNWILEHGTRVNRTVSEEDMKVIEDNINNLDNIIDRKNSAYDAGSSYILVWKNNEEIYLKESGDYSGENKSNASQKLISIINKYLK